MKKIHIIIAGFLSFLIVFFGVMYYLFTTPKAIQEAPEKLSEIQEVLSTAKQEELKKEIPLSLEKQKELNQIGEIYEEHQDLYTTTVLDILKKYKSDFTATDEKVLLGIVENITSQDELKTELQTKLGIHFLQNDIRKIFEAKTKLGEEKNLELTRLELFQEKNKNDISTQTRTLIEMSLQESISQNTTLNKETIGKIVQQVSQECFEKNNILDTKIYTSFEKQTTLLSQKIIFAFSQNTALSGPQTQILIPTILKSISDLGILLPSSIESTQEASSLLNYFFPASDMIQKLGFFMPVTVHAAQDTNTELTPERRQILLLRTQVLIDTIIQNSIETEISYNQGTLTAQEYNTLVNQHLVELEELLILKESLENDASTISLDDIQRFHLGSYKDDSTEIQNLTGIAYIQDKSGHIIIHNLNGSAKLGEENDLLYPGYGIETLENSSVTIVFADESLLRLDPFSRVNITTPSSTQISVAVERGNIWTRVLKPLLTGDTFIVDMGDVTLAVFGTSLSLSKDSSSGSIIHIVDSYATDGSPTVTLTEKKSGTQSSLSKDKEIKVDISGNIQTKNLTRSTLLNSDSKISQNINEDLKYLSLLIDDRTRGFYNTPISGKNDSDAFIKKIQGELTVSLPKNAETKYLITDSTLQAQVINTGSIYHILQKDSLIKAINSSNSPNKNQKIQIIQNLDMQALEKKLENKRALEIRFQYNIAQDIISQNFSTTGALENIFLNFPLVSTQNNEKILENVKRNLSINNGSNIVTGSISLPTYLSGVLLTWQSSLPNTLSNTGFVVSPTTDTELILTATLKKGNLSTTKDFGLIVIPKQLNEMEKLEAAGNILQKYFNALSIFGNHIDIVSSKMDELKAITGSGLSISWTLDSTIISPTGDIKQPSFNVGNIYGFTASGTLSTGGKSLTKVFTLPTIQKEDCNGTSQIIGGVCYGLVASAEYATPGDLDLKKASNNSIVANTQSENLLLSACQSTDFLGNCGWRAGDPAKPIGWTAKDFIATEYNYTKSLVGAVSATGSWMSYDGSAGIVVDNVGDPDYLSYDLSTLNLGTDWAIEMNVRGEDMKKRSVSDMNTYVLFNLSDSFSIFSWNGNGGIAYDPIYYGGGNNYNSTSGLNNNYQKVLLTKDFINIGDIIINHNKKFSINNKTIKIGSSKDNNKQWNGIINYIRIYEKK